MAGESSFLTCLDAGILTRFPVDMRLASVTGSQLLARLGGDEFALLSITNDLGVNEALATAAAAEQAQQLSSVLSVPIELDGEAVYVSVSVGVALATDHEFPEAVLHAADQAM